MIPTRTYTLYISYIGFWIKRLFTVDLKEINCPGQLLEFYLWPRNYRVNTQPLRQAVAKHKAESPPREANTVTLCPCSHS